MAASPERGATGLGGALNYDPLDPARQRTTHAPILFAAAGFSER